MSRYETIAGMLEDPLNLACVMREILRREKKSGGSIKILPPPIKHSESRLFYPTFREFLRIKRFSSVSDPESLDILVEVFSTGESIWYFSLSDGSEVGPFGSCSSAQKEVERMFINSGYLFLEKPPWQDKDCSSFPL
jgi:hypothetical protein